MSRSNYQTKKRQKELARKEKKEMKKQRKMDKKADESEELPKAEEDPGTFSEMV